MVTIMVEVVKTPEAASCNFAAACLKFEPSREANTKPSLRLWSTVSGIEVLNSLFLD